MDDVGVPMGTSILGNLHMILKPSVSFSVLQATLGERSCPMFALPPTAQAAHPKSVQGILSF